MRVRPAAVADAQVASAVLVASITELSDADHHSNAGVLGSWLADKTPAALAARIASGGVFVAEVAGQLVGVGEFSLAGLSPGRGKITLNYVAPAARFRGISRAMLLRLEAELAARGCTEGLLTATATATRFYLAAGWRPGGPPRQGRWIFGHPMRKRLG
ncbi:GNAT family N-acetyltransferase [Phaeovulum sp.]|uniref:GNAT family N-acetyltransferase n=1 Tax=Phaeovulum sp. TaxID=2934796 RepID=UPI002731EC65|nr:GNAT family N-acetyltransferase [Phaeovulum sp.]MDP1668377.1 GNAT family N-acetyltransferase [Phaeovulum sp.]MDZ4120128.1 GNAT family N-acetyltransferase [Phaeovulum sp.]